MPLYDLMLLLDPNAPDERREEIVSSARSTIEADGQLIGLHDWGMRRLAYEIDHRGEADYRLFQLEAAPELIDRLSHTLKITDGVLRFRVIRIKPGSPPPPEPRSAPARPEPRDEEGTAQVAARSAADAPPARGA